MHWFVSFHCILVMHGYGWGGLVGLGYIGDYTTQLYKDKNKPL